MRFACSSSWLMAAARKVSAAASTQLFPRSFRSFATFASVVVLPLPFTPTKSTTTGFFFSAGVRIRCSSPGDCTKSPETLFESAWRTARSSPPRGSGTPTSCRSRSARMRSTTSSATLLSSSAISISSNSFEKSSFESVVVAMRSRTLSSRERFGGSGRSTRGSAISAGCTSESFSAAGCAGITVGFAGCSRSGRRVSAGLRISGRCAADGCSGISGRGASRSMRASGRLVTAGCASRLGGSAGLRISSGCFFSSTGGSDADGISRGDSSAGCCAGSFCTPAGGSSALPVNLRMMPWRFFLRMPNMSLVLLGDGAHLLVYLPGALVETHQGPRDLLPVLLDPLDFLLEQRLGRFDVFLHHHLGPDADEQGFRVLDDAAREDAVGKGNHELFAGLDLRDVVQRGDGVLGVVELLLCG